MDQEVEKMEEVSEEVSEVVVKDEAVEENMGIQQEGEAKDQEMKERKVEEARARRVAAELRLKAVQALCLSPILLLDPLIICVYISLILPAVLSLPDCKNADWLTD